MQQVPAVNSCMYKNMVYLAWQMPKTGRPRKPPGEGFKARYDLRWTMAEAEATKARAKLDGVPMARWIRDRLAEARKAAPDEKARPAGTGSDTKAPTSRLARASSQPAK